MEKFKLGLVPKLILAIIAGILIGNFTPLAFVRIFKTFSTFFGSFLSFFIPLMIVGFVVSGIAKLTEGAGKLLGLTAVIAYVSTLIAGTFSYTVAANLYPRLIAGISSSINFTGKDVSPYFSIPLKAPFDVTVAIVFAFMMGITISYMRAQGKAEITFSIFNDFENIITRVLASFVIPLLPFHILGIFAELTYSGVVFTVIGVFIKIYLCIFVIHYIYMFIMFSIAGTISKKNPFTLIKNQLPAYFTAVGTQSSAATIPVNIQSGLKNGTSPEIVNFVIPLCATIHLSGSMITLTSCIMGILILNGLPFSLATVIPFIAMLGIAMVAAPGAPGGAVMAALPFLFMIGIDADGALGSLLIALYITQDSFGTAINVSGDNAIAIYVDEFYKKYIKKA
ncbi:MAG: dicarboxylate/amino acid:cation symporter [Fusobacterium sp.]|uniref:dicarboxylate/amino acid:cation symporter n=1 Tax=Fusobacterium sp. TaxID=68766 RepID=UPI0026DC05BE|nr:dicarboxylate/amino acid:cation symporter [Fusobacterium sp.]MDO4689913.1 dicarboxylate/amino acid:cation symporter [Fusobacterium sp.]